MLWSVCEGQRAPNRAPGDSRARRAMDEGEARVVILALDIGDARIGVAVSDELELIATPRPLIRRKSTAAALDAVTQEIARSEAQLVVVGLPVSFDGQLHAQARAIQAFGEKLRRRIAQPLIYADETLTSVRAEERLRAAGVRPEHIRERIDSEAAAIILEDVLELRRRERTQDAARVEDSQQEDESR